MNRLRNVFIALALITSHVMCADVAYQYRQMVCGVEHMAYSAPPEIVFLAIIPYLIVITIFIILAIKSNKKEAKSKRLSDEEMLQLETEKIDNFTARALLMPLKSTTRWLENTKFLEQPTDKRVKLLKEFAKQHGVEDNQALKRITEVLALNSYLRKENKTLD